MSALPCTPDARPDVFAIMAQPLTRRFSRKPWRRHSSSRTFPCPCASRSAPHPRDTALARSPSRLEMASVGRALHASMAMDMDMASVHTAVAHDTARWAQRHAGSLASSASTRASRLSSWPIPEHWAKSYRDGVTEHTRIKPWWMEGRFMQPSILRSCVGPYAVAPSARRRREREA